MGDGQGYGEGIGVLGGFGVAGRKSEDSYEEQGFIEK